jgi:cytochrome c551/c552
MRRALPLLLFGVIAGAFAAAPARLAAQESGSAFTIDDDLAKKGKALWSSRACSGCHTIGKGKMAGPDLAHVTERRTVEWLTKWLGNTTEMLQSDETAKALFEEYNKTPMPDFKMKEAEALAVLHHIAKESQKVKKSEK